MSDAEDFDYVGIAIARSVEGDAVAVVGAETEYQAVDAAEAIVVDVDEVALERPDTGAGNGFGDVEAAFEKMHHGDVLRSVVLFL